MKEDGKQSIAPRNSSEYIEHIKITAKPGVYFLSCAQSVIETNKQAARQFLDQIKKREGGEEVARQLAPERFKQIAQCCRTILSIDPEDPQALAYLGRCLAIPEGGISTGEHLIQEDIPEFPLTNKNLYRALHYFYKKAFAANPSQFDLENRIELTRELASWEEFFEKHPAHPKTSKYS